MIITEPVIQSVITVIGDLTLESTKDVPYLLKKGQKSDSTHNFT